MHLAKHDWTGSPDGGGCRHGAGSGARNAGRRCGTARSRGDSRRMLTRGVDVNATQVDGTTALHWAVHYDDAETAALLVKAGANVNAANRYGVPPLALACTNGNAAVVRLLLEAGADANATMKGGETVLMMAARSGSVDAVKALLVRGAKHDLRERHGQTALMWAAAEGHAPVVRALIEAGADINATLDSGFTPFFFAVREGRIEAVRVLLEKGIDVNAPIQRRERTAEGERQSQLHPLPADTQRHEPIAARGTERSLRARDRTGRRGCESKRCADGILAAPHHQRSPKTGFQRWQ